MFLISQFRMFIISQFRMFIISKFRMFIISQFRMFIISQFRMFLISDVYPPLRRMPFMVEGIFSLGVDMGSDSFRQWAFFPWS